jgi:hypothetical protein
MSWRPLAALAMLLCLLAPTPLPGQSRTSLLTDGIRAYERLELQRAMELLTRALAPGAGSDSLRGTQRADALTYLGAAEYFSGSRPAAAARFTQLLLDHPRYRMDHLLFPPELTEFFAEVRRRTPAVTVRYPERTRLQPGQDSLRLTLAATSPHDIIVTLRPEDGEGEHEIHSGLIGDSLQVSWDGRGTGGAAIAPGSYRIEISSMQAGRVARQVVLPLRAARLAADTLPHPVPPPPIPAPVGSVGPALRALGIAVGGGAAVMLLPRIIAPGSESTGGRTMLAGVLTITGLFAFASRVTQPREAPGTERAREAWRYWERRVSDVKRENAQRQASRAVMIEIGPPERARPEAP